MSDIHSTPEIEELRTSLADKLEEIQRRAAHARDMLSPSTYWRNPWVRLALGVALGFAFGSLKQPPGDP